MLHQRMNVNDHKECQIDFSERAILSWLLHPKHGLWFPKHLASFVLNQVFPLGLIPTPFSNFGFYCLSLFIIDFKSSKLLSEWNICNMIGRMKMYT